MHAISSDDSNNNKYNNSNKLGVNRIEVLSLRAIHVIC